MSTDDLSVQPVKRRVGRPKKIKEETKATIRCIPLNNKQEAGKCIYSGNPSSQRVVFARAY